MIVGRFGLAFPVVDADVEAAVDTESLVDADAVATGIDDELGKLELVVGCATTSKESPDILHRKEQNPRDVQLIDATFR